MKVGQSEEQFKNSGDIHDSVNTEAEVIGQKYASPPPPPKAPYNPLTDEKVNEKSYARANIKISPADASKPIPEPTIVPPPTSSSNTGKDGTVKEPPKPINPLVAELNAKEKTNAAKVAASIAMNAYEAAHMLGNHVIKVSDNKLKKLARKNLINLKMPVPVSPTQSVSLEEFVQAYNEETGNVFTVSKEFKEEVTPVLERVLEKKGIGATDEQQLIYLFSKDLVVKGAQLVALMGQRKQFINHLIDATDAYKKGFVQQQNHQAQQPPQQQNNQQSQSQHNDTYKPPYTQPPAPSPIEEDDAEEVEIIPNEHTFDELSTPIPEPNYEPMPEPNYENDVVDITDLQKEKAQKRTRVKDNEQKTTTQAGTKKRRRNQVE